MFVYIYLNVSTNACYTMVYYVQCPVDKHIFGWVFTIMCNHFLNAEHLSSPKPVECYATTFILPAMS